MISTAQHSPARVIKPASGEVHVWWAELEIGPPLFDDLRETLAPDELVRAARYRFPADRDRFIVGRSVLRDILARYLGVAPKHIGFSYGPTGKPAVAREDGISALRFNLSHSGGLAMYVIAVNREVGADLELIEIDFPVETIADKTFSPEEVRMLRSVPVSVRPEAFYRCWTCKEAYAKARGHGLALPLESFVVSPASGEAPRITGTAEGTWSLHSFRPRRDYMAALAVSGALEGLREWQWCL